MAGVAVHGMTDPAARWVRVKNTDAGAVPPFGLMEPAGREADTGAVLVRKPAADGAEVFVNAGCPVPAGGYGQGTRADPGTAAYDPLDGTPAAGEGWGPAAGSWLLRKGRPGFVALGGAGGGWVGVLRAGGGGAGGGVPERSVKEVTCSGGKLTVTYHMVQAVAMAVAGKVSAAGGAGASGVTVTVRAAGGGATHATGTTDSSGNYSVPFVGNTGTLEVTAGSGYTPSATAITFTSPAVPPADFTAV